MRQYILLKLARRTKRVSVGLCTNDDVYDYVDINIIDNSENFGFAIRVPEGESVCDVKNSKNNICIKTFVLHGRKWRVQAIKDKNNITIGVYDLVDM